MHEDSNRSWMNQILYLGIRHVANLLGSCKAAPYLKSPARCDVEIGIPNSLIVYINQLLFCHVETFPCSEVQKRLSLGQGKDNRNCQIVAVWTVRGWISPFSQLHFQTTTRFSGVYCMLYNSMFVPKLGLVAPSSFPLAWSRISGP